MHRGYVLHVPIGTPNFVGDESQYEAALLSLRAYVRSLTVERIKAGALEWPEGPPPYYLLPATVVEGEGV